MTPDQPRQKVMLEALKRDRSAKPDASRPTDDFEPVDPALKPQIRAVPPRAPSPRDRRGPFRPERLISLRERRANDMYARMFRFADAVVLAFLSFICASLTSSAGWLEAHVSETLPFLTALLLACWALGSFGLYRFARTESLGIHIAKVSLAVVVSAALSAIVARVSYDVTQVLSLLGLWTLTALGSLILLHLSWFLWVARWRRLGLLTPNIVIVGATKHARRLVDEALKRRDVNILGVFDDRLSRNPDSIGGVPVLGDTQSLLSHKITPYVDQIVIALDPSAKARVNAIIEKLKALPNDVSLLVDIHNESGRQAALSRMADLPLAKVSGISEDEKKAFHKRVQDVVVGTTALIVFSPIMLMVALAIKLDSPGPVFFRQRRHGFNNEAIGVWKFRSMRVEATDATASRQVTAGDDRVTRVGRFIRKTSLDELPQLFNVLAGEMSLVGPRPHAIGMKTGPDESALLVAEYAWRHRMKPGMTGWAAIHGSRGPLHNAEDVRRRITLDVEYIERQSVWLDLYIMALTVPCILGDRQTIR